MENKSQGLVARKIWATELADAKEILVRLRVSISDKQRASREIGLGGVSDSLQYLKELAQLVTVAIGQAEDAFRKEEARLAALIEKAEVGAESTRVFISCVNCGNPYSENPACCGNRQLFFVPDTRQEEG